MDVNSYGNARKQIKDDVNRVILPPHLAQAYVRLQEGDNGCPGCHTDTARYAKSLSDKMRGYLQNHGLTWVRELSQHLKNEQK